MVKYIIGANLSRKYHNYILMKKEEWNLPTISDVVGRILQEYSNGAIAPDDAEKKTICTPKCPCCGKKMELGRCEVWRHKN